MPDTPWAITSLKRKSRSSTPVTAKKRARIARYGDSPSFGKQQTLTQLDFIPSPDVSVFENDDFEDLKKEDGDRQYQSSSSIKRKPKLKRRDSTLTQMNFFDPLSDHEDWDGSQLSPLVNWKKEKEQPWVRLDDSQELGQEQQFRTVENVQQFRKSPPADKGEVGKEKSQDCHPTERPKRRFNEKSTIEATVTTFNPPTSVHSRGDSFVMGCGEQRSNDDQRLANDSEATETPQTPQRRRRTVPSSQSPESLPPSAKRTKISSPHSTKRTALQEISGNIPRLRSLRTQSKTFNLNSTTSKSPKRKVCILKEPLKGERQYRNEIEDSQDDVGIFNAISPPNENVESSQEENVVADNDQGMTVLPTDEEPMLLDNEENHIAATHVQEDEDEGFGPAVANDTQFISNLVHHTSSPRSSQKRQPRSSDSLQSNSRIPKSNLFSSARLVTEETPIPPPKLVRTSPLSNAAAGTLAVLEDDTSMLPAVSQPMNGHSEIATTKVPLNDNISSNQSSSPYLPSVNLATQRSIHPASIPHPSQISTQDPSQYGLQSSWNQPAPSGPGTQLDRIIITDSSSISGHSSGKARSEKPMPVDEVSNSTDDDEDLDLDQTLYHSASRSARKSRPSLPGSNTQIPTQATFDQGSHRVQISKREDLFTPSSSPVFVSATTRAERDARLEVIQLSPSQAMARHYFQRNTQRRDPNQTSRKSRSHNNGKNKNVDYNETDAVIESQLTLYEADQERMHNNELPSGSQTSCTSQASLIPNPSCAKGEGFPQTGFKNERDVHLNRMKRNTLGNRYHKGNAVKSLRPKPTSRQKAANVSSLKRRNNERGRTNEQAQENYNALLEWERSKMWTAEDEAAREADERLWNMNFTSSNPRQW